MRILAAALLIFCANTAFAATLIITGNSSPVNATGTHETTTVDTHIREAAATTNYDTASPVQTTKYGSGDHTHTLIKFDLSTVSGRSITSATLYLYANAGGSTSHTVSAYRLLRDWVSTEATWNIYSTGNNWGTAGAENTSSDIASTATDSVSPTTLGQYWSWDVTDDVALFAAGSASNYGWKLERTDGENDATFLQWRSGDEIGDTQPELVIVHEEASATTILPLLNSYYR